jgi:hypothetical protein
METWRLKIKPLRLYRLVVADSHYFEEELDPDLDPDLQSETLDPNPDPHLSVRIRNPGFFIFPTESDPL